MAAPPCHPEPHPPVTLSEAKGLPPAAPALRRGRFFTSFRMTLLLSRGDSSLRSDDTVFEWQVFIVGERRTEARKRGANEKRRPESRRFLIILSPWAEGEGSPSACSAPSPTEEDSSLRSEW